MHASAVAVPLETLPLAEALRRAARAVGVYPRPTRVARGEIVTVRTGLSFVTEGRLKVVRFSPEGRTLILELHDEGAVFGDPHVVDDPSVQPSYLEALTPVVYETLAANDVERLLANRPSLALSVSRLLIARCREAERRLESHTFHKVPTRLARQLLDLARRFGTSGPDGVRLDIRLSQQDLGGLIGASREIVSLTLTEFRRKGAISSRGRQLVIRERELGELAGGSQSA